MNKNSNTLIKIDNKETINIPKYKSTLKIGNIIVNNIKHFNCLQKRMFKIFFGIKIEDIKEVEDE